MPIDASIFKDVNPKDPVDAEDLRLRFRELQRFVNGGINPEVDFEESQFIETQHIEKPEFYGSPHPRVEAVSSDTIYRQRTNNRLDRYYRHEQSGSVLAETYNSAKTQEKLSAWQPIEGMSATVFVREDCTAFVMGNFYTLDQGGSDGFIKLKKLSEGEDRQRASYHRCLLAGRLLAETMLFVDNMDGSGPQAQVFSRRRIFSRGEAQYNMRRQNQSFTNLISLTKGENKVSYRCVYRLKRREDSFVKHLLFDARNFVVDCIYK
tara:strand:+ start:397 stop:1188 length:792 start_codon:yes stop_codon:yes gene_type:complete